MLQTWGDVLTTSFQSLSVGVITFVPNLIVAVIIFLAGWVVGSLLGNVVARVIRTLKLDNVLEGAGIGAVVHRAGFKLDSGKFLGVLVEWFVVIVFLLASFQVLGLAYVNEFIRQVVVDYLPRVIVAVLMLMLAGVVADIMQKVVSGSARAAGVKSANFLGTITRWAIWAFAIIGAMIQINVFAYVAQTLITGVIVALSVAFGLAFGLGGQDAAAQVIDRVRREVSEHNHQ